METHTNVFDITISICPMTTANGLLEIIHRNWTVAVLVLKLRRLAFLITINKNLYIFF